LAIGDGLRADAKLTAAHLPGQKKRTGQVADPEPEVSGGPELVSRLTYEKIRARETIGVARMNSGLGINRKGLLVQRLGCLSARPCGPFKDRRSAKQK